MRFMSGYVAINGMLATPSHCVNVFSCNNIMSPVINNVPKRISAFDGGICPLAMGRDAVRSTCLSRLRSHKSFITHPAARMMTAPMVNRAMIFSVSAFSDGAVRAMLHSAGRRRSQTPTGRSRRAKIA